MRPICPALENPMPAPSLTFADAARAVVGPRQRFAAASDRSVGSSLRSCSGARVRRRTPRSGAPFGAGGGSADGSHARGQAGEPGVCGSKLGTAQDTQWTQGRVAERAIRRARRTIPQTYSTPTRRRWRSKSALFSRIGLEGFVRLNKYISETGVCSRREADKWIEAGRVTCNGIPAALGTQGRRWG